MAQWLVGPEDVAITQLAERIHVTRATVAQIISGHSSITSDLAIRLGRALGTSSELWMGMQSAYDVEMAESKPRAGK